VGAWVFAEVWKERRCRSSEASAGREKVRGEAQVNLFGFGGISLDVGLENCFDLRKRAERRLTRTLTWQNDR